MKIQVASSVSLLIVSLCISACSSGNLPEPTSTPTLIPPVLTPTPISLLNEASIPTEVPTPSADEIRASIVNALLTLSTKPNRMENTTVFRDGRTEISIIEFVPPDRKHIVSPDAEYVVIGEIVYAKTSGKWEETSIPASTFMGDEMTAQKIGETISNVRFIRDDSLDGKAVRVYGYDTTTKAGDIELHSQVELWVGEMDGLPYKMIIDGDVYGISVDSATGESKVTVARAKTTILIDFDPAMNIEAPIQ